MAEPIDMPFVLVTRMGLKNHALDGGADPPKGMGNCWVHLESLLRCRGLRSNRNHLVVSNGLTAAGVDHAVQTVQ